MSNLDERLAHAKTLTDFGLPLFLVAPRAKVPLAAGWQADATTDYAEIERRLITNPDANLGVATGGTARLLVFDVDPKNDGLTSLADFQRRHGSLPPTFTVRTGSGGLHYYFIVPNDHSNKSSAGKIGPGLDTRGAGGLVVAPGSIHPSGGVYTLESNPGFLAPAPRALLDLLSAGNRQAALTGAAPFSGGRRNTDHFAVAGYLRQKGADKELISGALEGINARLANPLPSEEIEALAKGVMKYEAGYFLPTTEQSLAAEFASSVQGKFAYSAGYGWLQYAAGKWEVDSDGLHAQEAAKEFVFAIEASALARAITANDKEEAEKNVKNARQWQRASAIRNCLKLASSDVKLLHSAEEFDSNDGLINLTNGTLDLASGTFRPHAPADLLMKQANVAYNPQANCPIFDAFLEKILGQEKAQFILRALGYSLLGRPDEQKLFVLIGAGRNGKSTLVDTVREILGDYSVVVEPTTFMRKNNPGIGNDLARLKGARVAVTSEFAKGTVIDVPLVKRLTGNEPIVARFLHHEYFQFEAAAVFYLVSNFAPVIDGSDFALARRLILVSFDVVIPLEDIDQKLKAKLLGEREGILNRLLEGLKDFRSNGLAIPDVVARNSSSYVQEHDVVEQFIAEECRTAPDAWISAWALYQNFRTYCVDAGLQVMSRPSFKKTMEAKGFHQKRMTGGIQWIGVGSWFGVPPRSLDAVSAMRVM